ncbi:MAG: ribosome-binding factor A [Cetobacterium sp.]
MKRQRLAAIEKEVSKVVSQALFGEIKNPKIKKAIVSVTGVRVTEDLKFADLYFSIMPITGESFNKEEVLEGLNEVKGFLRKRVSEELALKNIPKAIKSLYKSCRKLDILLQQLCFCWSNIV